MIPAISFIINVGVFELCQWVYVGNLQKAKSRTACSHSPCSNTQGHNSCQKHMVFQESTFDSFFHSFSVMWPSGSACWLPHSHAHGHMHTHSLFSSLSLSCSCATLPLQRWPFWWCHLLNHYQIVLWLGWSRPLKGEGLSHGMGCYFLLVNLSLMSPSGIHNTYIHNLRP